MSKQGDTIIDVAPIFLREGDTLHVSHSVDGGPARELLCHPVDESMTINAVKVIKVQDGFGFHKAIGVLLGEKA